MPSPGWSYRAQTNSLLEITSYATVLFARLTRTDDGWDLTWASAGHLPPLMVTSDGTAGTLEQANGGLSIAPGLGGPSVGHIRLDRAATVVLYTDGLVERRGIDITDSIARLCPATAAFPSRSAPQGPRAPF